MANIPDPHSLIRNIVMRAFPPHTPVHGGIFDCDSLGNIEVLGDFNLPPAMRQKFPTLSLWDSHIVSQCIRTGQPIIENTDVSEKVTGEESPITGWTIVSPINVRETPRGCLLLCFPHEISETVRTEIAQVSTALALYMFAIGQKPSLPNSQLNLDDVSPSTGNFVLSHRQKEILKLASKGLTNARIAIQLGYSSSTIHQDLMLAYKFLGVHSKQEAVRKSQSLGYI